MTQRGSQESGRPRGLEERTPWKRGGQSGQTLLRGQERRRQSWPRDVAIGDSDKSHFPKMVGKSQLGVERVWESMDGEEAMTVPVDSPLAEHGCDEEQKRQQ